MNKMTPEYAEHLAKRAGCNVIHQFARGVKWLVISGPRGVEHVAVWYLFQMSEADFREWHLCRCVEA